MVECARLRLLKKPVLERRADLDAEWARRTSKTEELRGISTAAGLARILIQDCLRYAMERSLVPGRVRVKHSADLIDATTSIVATAFS